MRKKTERTKRHMHISISLKMCCKQGQNVFKIWMVLGALIINSDKNSFRILIFEKYCVLTCVMENYLRTHTQRTVTTSTHILTPSEKNRCFQTFLLITSSSLFASAAATATIVEHFYGISKLHVTTHNLFVSVFLAVDNEFGHGYVGLHLPVVEKTILQLCSFGKAASIFYEERQSILRKFHLLCSENWHLHREPLINSNILCY